jgi:hypothetical protein
MEYRAPLLGRNLNRENLPGPSAIPQVQETFLMNKKHKVNVLTNYNKIKRVLYPIERFILVQSRTKYVYQLCALKLRRHFYITRRTGTCVIKAVLRNLSLLRKMSLVLFPFWSSARRNHIPEIVPVPSMSSNF